MPVPVECKQCGSEVLVIPARAKTFKFCSIGCKADWQRLQRGEDNPKWQDLPRRKECQYCGETFSQKPTEAISTFTKRKFCSKPCADVGGFRYKGETHPNYRPDAIRTNRGNDHAKWASAVISRDHATCQRCGAMDKELHAHHIKPWRQYPDLRFDVDNGQTLCCSCHWDVHSALSDNGVNSGEALTVKAEGNPEPSLNGNVQEGVTTRGRAYRRWNGNCENCGKFLSKQLSRVTGKKHVYCSSSCSATHYWARQRQ